MKIGLYNGESIFKTFGDEVSRDDNLKQRIDKELRVAIPAKITKIDYDKMTCECQPLIREKMRLANGQYTGVDLPLLLDVPIVYSGSTDYSITFPLKVGDEGLVIFADMCIDTWWQSGDVQDQFEARRHDLSDGFFIPAQLSQPKKYTNIDQANLEIKNRISGTGIKVTNEGVTITGKLTVTGDAVVSEKSFNTLVTNYNSHTHIAPEGGGTTTGPSGRV